MAEERIRSASERPASAGVQASERAVFPGQRSHRLTDYEWGIFTAFHIRFEGNYEEETIDSLAAIKDSPTAAMEMRNMLNSGKYFYVHSSRSDDKLLERANAEGAYVGGEEVLLHRKLFDNPVYAGQITMHEFLHGATKMSGDTNRVLADAETQALHRQIAAEMPWDPQNSNFDVSYTRSYQNNRKNFLKKARNRPELKTPEAQEAWAMEHASLKTRADFIKDWVNSPDNVRDALSVNSYSGDSTRYLYKEQTEDLSKKTGNSTISQKDIDALVEKYKPYLKRSDFRYLKKENDRINREAEVARASGNNRADQTASNTSHRPDPEEKRRKSIQSIDAYLAQGNGDTPIGRRLPEIRQKLEDGDELTLEEDAIRSYVRVREDPTCTKNPEEKRYGYDTAIALHQRGQLEKSGDLEATDPVRTQMIEESNADLGLHRPVVQNDRQGTPENATDTLTGDTSSGLCGTLDTHSKDNITAQPNPDRDQQIPGRTSDGAVLS